MGVENVWLGTLRIITSIFPSIRLKNRSFQSIKKWQLRSHVADVLL